MGRRRTSTNTHRQHQKKQIKNQSKKITHTYLGNEDTHKEKIPTLTVDTQSKVDWSKHNNQGYVLYAMRTADLKKWQSSSYQSKLRDFTQLEQPLKPTIPLIRIYIPLRIQLPLQLPYFTYEHRMVSESNPSTTPDDLRGAVPPKNTSLSSHQTSERILSFAYPKHTSLATPPYMSNVKLVAKEFLTAIPSVASSYFTQEWQVIYAQALIPAPPSTYWTLSHSLR